MNRSERRAHDRWLKQQREPLRRGMKKLLAKAQEQSTADDLDDRAASADVAGWHFLLTIDPQPDGDRRFHLSAQMRPRGRDSTGQDWQMLGAAARQIGAPKDAWMTAKLAHPNAPQHFQWLEHPDGTKTVMRLTEEQYMYARECAPAEAERQRRKAERRKTSEPS